MISIYILEKFRNLFDDFQFLQLNFEPITMLRMHRRMKWDLSVHPIPLETYRFTNSGPGEQVGFESTCFQVCVNATHSGPP